MTSTHQDRIAITDLVNRHGHLVDAGDLDELDALFTPDVVYDVTALGFGSLRGTAALREAALALGTANPVGHHVTNIVITDLDENSARVRSKGIGITTDGKADSVVYDDTVVRHSDGWKISHRRVIARREPLSGRTTGPVEILERWRRAVVKQSTKDLADLYAVDAVHEFPFTRPEFPSRLTGRGEILAWTTTIWNSTPLRYARYRTLALHHTGDPGTIVVEQEAVGTHPATGDFVLPNLIVLTTRHGWITHLRDYVDIEAAGAALGSAVIE
ncbi:hypothetical protein GCM10022243_09890 [Saccharothrix violaceirubra]|uniref:Ketosteroid isomerase-like protein n=1 Tax=Saccharothrix violaceirubra TaxID=413306 RepID=A0A7W7T428_9PSEU|nr:nuclear transport factor 2 family protein [Saccharothrix violaceirubra]MBB4966174.1 ketosteroid isomerase-like protein [Saccharothrix violaceirubra]